MQRARCRRSERRPSRSTLAQPDRRLDLVNSVGSDQLTVWHVVNNHAAANVSPQRYGRFEVLLSGSASNCFASIFVVATR